MRAAGAVRDPRRDWHPGLQGGRLRATLAGNHVEVNEFTLEGGLGSQTRIPGQGGNLSTAASEAARGGGTLTVRGDMSWGPAPAPGAAAPAKPRRARPKRARRGPDAAGPQYGRAGARDSGLSCDAAHMRPMASSCPSWYSRSSTDFGKFTSASRPGKK